MDLHEFSARILRLGLSTLFGIKTSFLYKMMVIVDASLYLAK